MLQTTQIHRTPPNFTPLNQISNAPSTTPSAPLPMLPTPLLYSTLEDNLPQSQKGKRWSPN